MLTQYTQNMNRKLRAGFTLIEILAVILIIGILMVFLLPKIPEAIDRAKVTACKKNLQEIYNGLTMYNEQYKRLPEDGGVKFFTCLVYRKTWENTNTSAQKLTCPAVDISVLALKDIENSEDWYTNKDVIDGDYSAYAGRDLKNFPLKKWPPSGHEPIVGDDNVGSTEEMNHRTATCVLYGDGAVQTHELVLYQEKGEIPKEEKVLVVGPDSPIEILKKLSLD